MTINVQAVGGGDLQMSSGNLPVQSLMETLATKLRYISPYEIEEYLSNLKTPEDIPIIV